MKLSIKKRLRSIWFYGFNFSCPLCGFNARKFLDQGLVIRRTNAKCPKCKTHERTRILWLHLKETVFANIKSDFNVLAFAPEPETHNQLKKIKNINYKSSRYPLKEYADVVYDITNIPDPKDTYELIIVSHVLEHVADDIKAMEELYRVLRPKGKVMIMVPLWPSLEHPTYENPKIVEPTDRLMTFGQSDHLRIYGLDIKDRLTSVGFNVNVIDYVKENKDTKVNKFSLRNSAGISEIIFECIK